MIVFACFQPFHILYVRLFLLGAFRFAYLFPVVRYNCLLCLHPFLVCTV